MAYSYNEVGALSPGDTLEVPFPFLERGHVTVTVDGVLTDKWSWLSDGLIKTSSGFPSGAKTRASRNTPVLRLSSILTGPSVFDWEGINSNFRRILYAVQEYLDNEDRRNAVIDGLQGDIARAVAARQAAEVARDAAKLSASQADGFADEAHETLSSTLESSTLASKWASNPENVEVVPSTGLYSAFHWYRKAYAIYQTVTKGFVEKIGSIMTGLLTIQAADNAYGLWVERKNSVFQGVLMRLRTLDVAGTKFGPKINFLKDGGEAWNIGLRNGTDGGFAFSAGANEASAGGERFIVTAAGVMTLYDGANGASHYANGDITFSSTMAAQFGASLSTALSNKVSVNYTTNENETVFPLGTTIPVAGSFGTGTPRNYIQAIYHSNNYAYATTSVNGASQLAGTWRMIGTISSSIALFRRVG